MSFHICCPQCGAFCNVSDEDVGKTALCGNCDQPIIISRAPISSHPYQPTRAIESATLEQPISKHELDPVSARALLRPDAPRTAKLGRFGCAVMLGLALVALLLPLYSNSREPARKSQCNNNLKQIGLALHNYHDTHGSFPPPYIADENGRPMHSWRVLILPFMEEQNLYDQYDFDEPWDGPNNRNLWSQMPDAYRCQSARDHDEFVTPYQVLVGRNTPFERGRTNSVHDIYDGTANTILVVEAASRPVNWMEPNDVQYQPNAALAASLWSSNHEGNGLHVLYADGSTGFLDERVRAAELRFLIERADGAYRVR